jgi:hypothetical protein
MVHKLKARWMTVLFDENGKIVKGGMLTRSEFKEVVGKEPRGIEGHMGAKEGRHVRYRKVMI